MSGKLHFQRPMFTSSQAAEYILYCTLYSPEVGTQRDVEYTVRLSEVGSQSDVVYTVRLSEVGSQSGGVYCILYSPEMGTQRDVVYTVRLSEVGTQRGRVYFIPSYYPQRWVDVIFFRAYAFAGCLRFPCRY